MSEWQQERPNLPPYVKQDASGALHIDIPKLLSHFGYADTIENREICVDVAREVCGERFPGVRVEVV